MTSRPRLTAAKAVAAAAAAVATFAACAPSAPTEGGGGGAVTDATLTIATTTDVVNYNPLVGNSRSDYWITNLMYPHLLSIGADGDKAPELAEKWGYVDDTTGFYEIRSGMKWSDGTPLTAKDVAYTLNAVKKDKPAGTLYGQLTNFESATAVSDTRVEVKLSKPDSTVIPEVGFWGNVVPQHVFEPAGSVATFANDGKGAGKDGGWVSAGPYVLTDVQRGQSYTLERVDDYPLVEGGKPKAAKIVYRVYPDVNTEILSLKNGDVDVIANSLPPAQVKGLQNTQGITVEEVPGLGYAHMTYNMSKPDLAKKEVRLALAHAVDYAAIRKVVLADQAVSTGSSPIMPVLKDFYDDSIKEYEFDPEKSKQLLTDAGYRTDGSLKFRLIYSLQDPVTTQWATLVKDGAAKAGITIELQGLERNTYLAKTDAGDYDIYAGNFAIMDDPATNMALCYLPGGAINYTHVDDPQLSSLIEQARVTFEREDQKPILQQAAKIVRDNVYDNIMYTQNLYVAHRSEWSGFVVKPSELLSIVNPISVASATKSES